MKIAFSALKKHDGVRPKKPSSFDCSVNLKNLEDYRARWEVVKNKLD